MSVYKRFYAKKVVRGDRNYDKGTWYARGMVDGVRYHKPLNSAKTKAEALAEEDLIVAKIRHGEFDYIQDKTKFSEFVDEIYLPYCRVNNVNYRQKTYELKTLKDFFGKSKLKAVSPSKIEEFKRKRLAEKRRCQKCLNDKHEVGKTCESPLVSTSAINRELSTLRKLFSVAVQNRKLKENPMRFVKMLAEPKPRERYLSDYEKQRLFASAGDNKRLLSIVLLGLSTGWRKGQILHIKTSDLDSKNKAVSIIKSKKNPPRKVPVSTFAWEIFEKLAEQAEEAGTEWLFFNEKTKERLGDFRTTWRTALKNAGIEGFRFHDLRHTFATDLLELGAAAFTIQTALGHSEIKTTEIYTHVKDNLLRKQLEQLGEKQNPRHYTNFTPSEKN